MDPDAPLVPCKSERIVHPFQCRMLGLYNVEGKGHLSMTLSLYLAHVSECALQMVHHLVWQ